MVVVHGATVFPEERKLCLYVTRITNVEDTHIKLGETI